MKMHVFSSKTPDVSIATGLKIWLVLRWLYFKHFVSSARATTAPCDESVKSVGTCGVPDKQLSTLPWYYGHTVGAFPIWPIYGRWFQPRRNLYCWHSPENEVVHGWVVMMAALAPSTALPVSGCTIHYTTTVVAGVRPAELWSQP